MGAGTRVARAAAALVGLALLSVPARARAQDAPVPTPAPSPDAKPRALEDEVRELRERVRKLEAAAAAAGKGTPTTEAPAADPPGGAAPGAGATQRLAPGSTPPESGPAKPREGGTPRIGEGAVGPGQQEPERAPAPGLEERVTSVQETLRRAPSAGVEGVELHLALDLSFVWNANDPRHRRIGVNVLRVNDPDHDSFEVSWAKLALVRSVNGTNEWDVGFHFGFAFGREAQTTLSLDPHFLGGEAVNLTQTYVDLQMPTPVGNPLLIRVGRFYSWFGVESLDTPLNPNYSLSYFTDFTPFTTTGVGVGMDLPLGFRYMQFLVNGWDVVIDNNDAKTVGGQLSWTHKDGEAKTSDLVVALNWIFGPERTDDDKHARQQVELDASARPFDATTFLAAIGYGQEEHGAVAPDAALVGPGPAHELTGKFGGVMGIVRQELGEVKKGLYRFAVAARVEYWRDQGGNKSGLDQALVEATGTVELHFTENGRLRFEVRRDGSSRDHFFIGRGGTQSRDEQFTVSMDAAYAF